MLGRSKHVSGLCENKQVLFFKQRAAYEMRISDWSSDVCSSDLEPRRFADLPLVFDAYVGRELRHELVTQPKPGLDRRQPRADADLADVLRGEFDRSEERRGG